MFFGSQSNIPRISRSFTQKNYYYHKMFGRNVKFTGKLKFSYSYVALGMKTRNQISIHVKVILLKFLTEFVWLWLGGWNNWRDSL